MQEDSCNGHSTEFSPRQSMPQRTVCLNHDCNRNGTLSICEARYSYLLKMYAILLAFALEDFCLNISRRKIAGICSTE